MTRAQFITELNALITDPLSKQNTAARVRAAFLLLAANWANLEEDGAGGGSSFDPKNIETFVRLIGDVNNRWVGKSSQLEAGNANGLDSNIDFQNEVVRITSGRLLPTIIQAYLQLVRTNGSENAEIGVSSPSGNNFIQLTPTLTSVGKLLRYLSTPSISNNLDIPHKKWIDDNFLAIADYESDRIYKGSYTTEAALLLAWPNPKQGWEAIVDDPATSDDAIKYVVDAQNGESDALDNDGDGDTDESGEIKYVWIPSATTGAASFGTLSGSPNDNSALVAKFANYLLLTDISNILTGTATNKALSEAQGKALKDLIDALTTTVGGKQDALTAAVLGTLITSQTEKTTIVDADEALIEDTVTGQSRKVTFLNIWNYIKAKADAIYLAVMTGATAGLNGTSGRVTAPLAGEQNHLFVGDGTWKEFKNVARRTQTNDVAASGFVGEVFTASGTTALASGVAGNLGSLVNLPPGNWNVKVSLAVSPPGGGTVGAVGVCSNTVSGTFQVGFGSTRIWRSGGGFVSNPDNITTGFRRYELASTTTIFCVGFIQFSGGVPTLSWAIEAEARR